MKLPSITLQKAAIARFSEVIAKEWIITNSLGGYASQTVPAINTRKYHGLLVAALHPPGERVVCLSKLDEDLFVGNQIFRLGSNDFQEVTYPEGYKLIDTFSLDPFPKYTYCLSKVSVEKTVFLPKYKNAVAVAYTINNQSVFPAKIRIYPLLTCRYFHTLIDRSRIALNFNRSCSTQAFKLTFTRPQATIVCRATDGRFVEALNWVDRLHYREEAQRGEADKDDCFQPGYFEVQVAASSTKAFALTCAVSTESDDAWQNLDSMGYSIKDVSNLYLNEMHLREELLDEFYARYPNVPPTDWLNWALLAADSFMVESVNGHKSIIAGYFWFEPWSRDAFISLPGLTLVTGKYGYARDILYSFIGYCKDGLIPNFVADRTGVPVYNTVDGTLWYINAVYQYLKYSGDFVFVRDELWHDLKVIVEYHKQGTNFGIKVDSDGLLAHGPRLTWMDAVVEGEAITPRTGKAVEIQALWYNALRIMALLANRFGEKDLAQHYIALANQTSRSFNEEYWNSKLDCLYDVLGPNGVDASLRPNQIFAVSLDFTMLDSDRSQKVVNHVNRDLVTPYGLRTLSLNDSKFVGQCAGDRRSRDTAYHNGTIWPWLLGPYVTAQIKVNGHSASTREEALQNLILPLFTVGLQRGGLGTISEIYDCDPPTLPRGCIAQAWSVAEPLRSYLEDVLKIRPKFEKQVMAMA